MHPEIDHLLSHALFNGIAIEPSLLDTMRVRQFDKGDVIYRPGVKPSHAFLITDGSIKFEMSASSGQQVFVEMIDKGYLFGELELLSEIDYQSTAIANEKTSLILIPKETLFTMITGNPVFALKFIRQMATNFYLFQIVAADRESSNLKNKLATLLISLSLRFGKKDGDSISMEVSHDQLSDMLNASRQRVNIQLNEWQKEGMIQCKYGTITINDIQLFSSKTGLLNIITEDRIKPYS